MEKDNCSYPSRLGNQGQCEPRSNCFFRLDLTSLSSYNLPEWKHQLRIKLLEVGGLQIQAQTRDVCRSPHSERTPGPPPPPPLKSGPCLWCAMLSGGISAVSPLPRLVRDFQTQRLQLSPVCTMVLTGYLSIRGGGRQEEQVSEVIFCYITSSQPVWAT